MRSLPLYAAQIPAQPACHRSASKSVTCFLTEPLAFASDPVTPKNFAVVPLLVLTIPPRTFVILLVSVGIFLPTVLPSPFSEVECPVSLMSVPTFPMLHLFLSLFIFFKIRTQSRYPPYGEIVTLHGTKVILVTRSRRGVTRAFMRQCVQSRSVQKGSHPWH